MRVSFAIGLTFVLALIFVTLPIEVRAQKIPPGALATRGEALKKARIDDLKSGMTNLGIKLSQVNSAKDSNGVQLAGFRAHGPRRQSTSPIPSDDYPSSPNVVETSPASEIHLETIPGVIEGEIVGEMNGSGVPTSVPFVQPLEPPIAPTPSRPAHCVPREIFSPDPAFSWKLDQRKTVITLLPRPGERSPDTDTTSDDTTSAQDKKPTNTTMATRAFVFDCSAYFPIMRFKNRFKSYEDEGVRIVEGMALRLAADGSYEVEFLVEGLSTPVTVRLQFSVTIDGHPGTLTLPPLTLDPRSVKRFDELPNTWSVVDRGASSFLRTAFPRAIKSVTLSRDGVARFGAGIEPIISSGR